MTEGYPVKDASPMPTAKLARVMTMTFMDSPYFLIRTSRAIYWAAVTADSALAS
jgi:hypothetical protein